VSVTVSRQEFYEALLSAFDEQETRTLCSIRLGIDYDNLPGEGLAAKHRELIAYFERRDRNGELIGAVSAQRPRLLKLDTSRLGPLLRVNGDIPDPARDRDSFYTAMAQRSVVGECQHKLTLVAVLVLVLVELLRLVLGS
jgi:hypothetical protein